MTVTKQHFEMAARILSKANKDLREDCVPDGWYSLIVRDIARDFADVFAEENPRFNRDRFMVACGIEE